MTDTFKLDKDQPLFYGDARMPVTFVEQARGDKALVRCRDNSGAEVALHNLYTSDKPDAQPLRPKPVGFSRMDTDE